MMFDIVYYQLWFLLVTSVKYYSYYHYHYSYYYAFFPTTYCLQNQLKKHQKNGKKNTGSQPLQANSKRTPHK